MKKLTVVAIAVTLAAVTFGVVKAAPALEQASTSGAAGAAIRRVPAGELAASRSQRLSRTAERVTLKPRAVGHKYATAPLNIWQAPRERGKRFGLVTWGTRLAVTGQRVGHWAEVLLSGHRARWVNATFLASTKPKPAPAAPSSAPATTNGISTAPCPDGSATESGLVPSAVTVFRAVCAAFPELTTYGGWAPRGEHANGHAVDFMITSSSEGQAIADWVQAHAAELNIYDVIWSQHIWTPARAGEGWRLMPDRGSPTANHYDHVHVATN